MERSEPIGFRHRFDLITKWSGKVDMRRVPDEILHHALLCYIRNGGAVETTTYRRHIDVLYSLSPTSIETVTDTATTPTLKTTPIPLVDSHSKTWPVLIVPSSSLSVSTSLSRTSTSTYRTITWDRLPLSLLDMILICLRTEERLGRAQPVNRVWRSRVRSRHAWKTIEWPSGVQLPFRPIGKPRPITTIGHIEHDTRMQRLLSLCIALPHDVALSLEQLEVCFNSTDDRFREMEEWLLQTASTSSAFVRLRSLMIESSGTKCPPGGLRWEQWWKVMPVLESLTLLVQYCDKKCVASLQFFPSTLTTLRTCGCTLHQWHYPHTLRRLSLRRVTTPIDLSTLHALQYVELEITTDDNKQELLIRIIDNMLPLPHLHTVQFTLGSLTDLLDTPSPPVTVDCEYQPPKKHPLVRMSRERHKQEQRLHRKRWDQRMLQSHPRTLSTSPPPTLYGVYLPRPRPPRVPISTDSSPPSLGTLRTQDVRVTFAWWLQYFKKDLRLTEDKSHQERYEYALQQHCRHQLATSAPFMIFLPNHDRSTHTCSPSLPLPHPHPKAGMLHCAHMRIVFAPLLQLVEKKCLVTVSTPFTSLNRFWKKFTLHPCPCGAPTIDL